MPSAFRFNFTQSRPSPQAEEPDELLSASSTEWEKPNPLSTHLDEKVLQPRQSRDNAATEAELAEPAEPEVGSAPISSVGLSEEESQFVMEERVQWEGELRRTKVFDTLLQSLINLARQHDEERRRRVKALLDAQEQESTGLEIGRQAQFDRDQDMFMVLAEESHSQREDDCGWYENMREKVMKDGRVQRTGIKESLVAELGQQRIQFMDNQEEDFEQQQLWMSKTVQELIQKAKDELEILRSSKEKEASDSKRTSEIFINAPPRAPYTPSFPASSSPLFSPGPMPIVPYTPGYPPTVIQPPPMSRRSSGSFRSWPRSRSPRLTISGGAEDTPLFGNEVERREYEWIVAERARDEAEGDRQALFNAALEAMRRNFTSAMTSWSQQMIPHDSTRNNKELKRDVDFETSISLVTSTFKGFTTRIEKRFNLLDEMEEAYNHVLTNTLKTAAETEGRILGAKRQKRWRKFDKLQAERREELEKVFDELLRLKGRGEGELSPVFIQPPLASFPLGMVPVIPGHPPFVVQPPSPVWPGIQPVHVMPAPIFRPPTPAIVGHPHPRPIIVTARPDGDSDSEASRSRSPSPPTGFAPQALFKMRNLSSLPLPKLNRRKNNVSSSQDYHKLTHSQRAALLEEGLLKRRFTFAINETKRQIKFEQMQAERQRVFDAAELKRADEFEQSEQKWIQAFLESQWRRESEFRVKIKQRFERVQQEQERIAKEYLELEERLTKRCLENEKQRSENLKQTLTDFEEAKVQQWEEDGRRENQQRKEKFGNMLEALRR